MSYKIWILSSNNWGKVERCSSALKRIVLLRKYSVYERWVSHIGSNALSSWFSTSFPCVNYWALLSYSLILNSNDLRLFNNLDSSFLSWTFPRWNWETLFLTMSIELRFFIEKILSSSFKIFHSSSHNNHFKLLFHYKVILLDKIFLYLLLWSFFFKLFDFLNFWFQSLRSFCFFQVSKCRVQHFLLFSFTSYTVSYTHLTLPTIYSV